MSSAGRQCRQDEEEDPPANDRPHSWTGLQRLSSSSSSQNDHFCCLLLLTIRGRGIITEPLTRRRRVRKEPLRSLLLVCSVLFGWVISQRVLDLPLLGDEKHNGRTELHTRHISQNLLNFNRMSEGQQQQHRPRIPETVSVIRGHSLTD